MISDCEKYDLSKVLDEVIRNILELNFEHKETILAVKLLCLLNTTYENHSSLLKAELDRLAQKEPFDCLEVASFELEEKWLARKKTYFRLLVESYLYGLIKDFKDIQTLILNMITNKKCVQLNFFLISDILKTFGEVLFRIRPKIIAKLIEVDF